MIRSANLFLSTSSLLFALFPTSCRAVVIPQMSQEDQLRSFESYSDVTMFHYTVPREVLRATWQFAAFSTDDPTRRCYPRKVYIHIKFGSYPVITANDSLTKEDHLTTLVVVVTTNDTNVTVVPIYEPQPGDWFVAAYMPSYREDDRTIRQRGLGRECRYGIGTVALWSRIDDIKNIPLDRRTRLRTSATTTYYKIYIPSGISSFRLSVWNCSFTLLHNFHDDLASKPCIEAMYLKGRVLPMSDQFHSTAHESTLTSTDASYYSFVELSPYEDSYYYLAIISNSVVEFDIKVDTTECPVGSIENQQGSVTGTNEESMRRRGIESWYYKENDDDEFYSTNGKRKTTDNRCVPRYRLIRVKRAFSTTVDYLLGTQGKENSKLILIDSIPIMTQFDILPLIDIGGTLDIDVHLEVNEIPRYYSVTPRMLLVTMCIQRDRIPKLEDYPMTCQNGTFAMTLSSLNKRDASSSIPYPQPGTWYILILATCYEYGKPVLCRRNIEEISISLNVRAKKCTCATNRGECREIQRNVLHYATCDCFKGYTGWDCTHDDTSTNTEISLTSAILLVTSNVFFIPAIYVAVVQRKLYAEGLVYLITMLFSSLYHACDESSRRFCVARYEVLQYSDFFSSILAFWVTLIAMAKLPIAFVPLCHMTGVFVVTFGVQIDRMGLIGKLIPLSLGVVILIFTRIIYRTFRSRSQFDEKPSRKILLGLLFATTGLLIYSFVETEKNYQYAHSVWHIIMAISLIFLLPKSERTTSASINASFGSTDSDSESWNREKSYGISLRLR